MSRVNIHRDLVSLNDVIGHFAGFPAGRSRQHVIISELRVAARKLQLPKAQAFYSMRDVALFFGVPLGTVARVYKVLEREGIINRIRSSHTMLAGKETTARESIRGVVGIYVWLHSMMHLTYTQDLVMEFEERLCRLGYVADIIFHSAKEEETKPEFACRLLRHRLDVAVLHTPLPGNRQNILSLRERGMRVFVIQRKDSHHDLPAVIYIHDYQQAYQAMAKRWREAGIRKAFLCTPPEYLDNRSELDLVRTALDAERLDVELAQDEPAQLWAKVRKRTKDSTAVVFLDCLHSELTCNRNPYFFERIARIARLAFCTGPIRVPYLQFRNVRADVVAFSSTDMASRLAEDITRLSVLPDGVYHTFVANYHEQILI